MTPDLPLKPPPDDLTPDPRRVRRIVHRAQRQVAARDMVNFGVGRVWVAIVGVVVAIFGFFSRPPKTGPSPPNPANEEGS